MATEKRPSPRILLLMGTSHGYGRDLINGITQYLFESGFTADFELRGHLEPIPPWVKHWKGDGVIVRHNRSETFAMLERMGVPCVKLNCPDHPSDLDIDENALGEMAVEHFAQRGLRNFAFFTQCDHYWTRRRRDGFRRAVEKRGAVFHLFERRKPDTPPFLTWSEAERKEFIQWLHELPKPVGILTSYDFHARQVLDGCQHEGISVPNEIAVLGVNNEEWFCRIQSPPLSSMIQCGRKVGYEAARILCAKIRGQEVPKLPLLFPPMGVEMRESTDLVAIDDEDTAQTLRLIRDRACDGITIDEIVERVGLSRRTLERRFKEQFGRTLGEEMLHVRLTRAREMLCDSDLPVGNIARRLGFCSHAYFNHVFRQFFGETPSDCRERFQVH